MSDKGEELKKLFEYQLENEKGIPVTIYKNWNTEEMSFVESQAIKYVDFFELSLQTSINIGDVIQPLNSKSFWKVIDTDEDFQERTMIKLIAKVTKVDRLGNEISIDAHGKAIFNAPIYGGVQVGGQNNSQDNIQALEVQNLNKNAKPLPKAEDKMHDVVEGETFSDNTKNLYKKDIINAAIFTLAYFILGGPIASLYIQNSYNDGNLFISLYAHLYRYPLFFGWITVPLLFYSTKYLKRVKDVRLLGLRTVIITLTIAVTIFLVVDIWSDNIAPFEIKAELLQNDPQLKDHFTKELPTNDEKITYQNKMIELIKEISNWSNSRYLHYLAIGIQVLNLLCIGLIAFTLTINGLSGKYKDSFNFKLSLLYCALAALISYIWALMRIAFNFQKPIYFPEISNPLADLGVVFSFSLITLVIMIALIGWIGDKLSFFISLVAFLGGMIGIFSVTGFKKPLLHYFGRYAGSDPCWTLLCIICVAAIFIFWTLELSSPKSGSTA